MLNLAIQNNIKSVLDEKGITGYQLAQMMDKHSNYVYQKIVKPKTIDHMRLKTLVQISEVLNVPIDTLFTKT